MLTGKTSTSGDRFSLSINKITICIKLDISSASVLMLDVMSYYSFETTGLLEEMTSSFRTILSL